MGQARSRSMAAGPAWSCIGGMQRAAPGATEQEALNPPTPPGSPSYGAVGTLGGLPYTGRMTLPRLSRGNGAALGART